MKKINIKDLELTIDITYILNLYASKTPIIIDVDGNIYTKLEEVVKKAIIYKNMDLKQFPQLLDAKTITSQLFSEYKPNITGTICKIKPVSNWQNIIDMNKENMLYFDHQSDGVEIFEDKTLENYGWHASDLEINYRELSEFIEENCSGTLLCYDNEIQFSGLVIVDDLEESYNNIITFKKENLEYKFVSRSKKKLTHLKEQIDYLENHFEDNIENLVVSPNYLGKKKKVSTFILNTIRQYANKNSIMFDLMTGSGSIAGEMAKYWTTFSSDLQSYANIFAYSQGRGFSKEKANELINEYMCAI